MKLIFLFLLTSTLSLKAQNEFNLNGVWKDSVSTDFTNCYAIITQQGNKITFSHYLEWKGHPFAEIGSGKITGNKLKYKVKVTLPIEGWATEGVHDLVLSADGKTLRGVYIDNKGNTGPLVFKR